MHTDGCACAVGLLPHLQLTAYTLADETPHGHQFFGVRKDHSQSCFPRHSRLGQSQHMRKTQCRELHPQRLFPAQTVPFSSSAPPTISAVSSRIWGTVLIWMANGVEGAGGQLRSWGHHVPLTHAGTLAPCAPWVVPLLYTSFCPEGDGAGAPACPSHRGPRPGAHPGRTSRARHLIISR